MNIVKQVGIILIVSLIVVALSLPLANTEWAEGFRVDTGEVEEGERLGDEGGEGGEIAAGTALIASFMKEIIFMGIPGLITLGILKLTRRSRTKRKQARKQQRFAEAAAP